MLTMEGVTRNQDNAGILRANSNNNCKIKKTLKKLQLSQISNLADAKFAGTKKSNECTLILTDGDYLFQYFALGGLGILGFNRYGVFPIERKVIDIRQTTLEQIMANAEVKNLLEILGLQCEKKFETVGDMKCLRYGRLMIMTDPNESGSYFKALVIYLFSQKWPSLLRLPFLEECIFPTVRVKTISSLGRLNPWQYSFYSLPEFQEWKMCMSHSNFRVKRYSGINSWTFEEASDWFSNIQRQRITFRHDGNCDDDEAIQLAFSNDRTKIQKLLADMIEEAIRRHELRLPKLHLIEKDTRQVCYQDFLKKELVLFLLMESECSIPSLVDGLTLNQRKVLYTYIVKHDKCMTVYNLVNSVMEHSAFYPWIGVDAYLAYGIIYLAHNFVGTNNINLFSPIGLFGSRLKEEIKHVGRDSEYLYTVINNITRKIFHPIDDSLLNYGTNYDQIIEPKYYVPIIPMILVNGGYGNDQYGAPLTTNIPKYKPQDLVDNIIRMLNKENLVPMTPWFKGFKGTVERLDGYQYCVSGKITVLSPTELEITEIPIGFTIKGYKESVLDPLMCASENKAPAMISYYKEYHHSTDKEETVRFVVTTTEEKMQEMESMGLLTTFKLQSTYNLTPIVLYDSSGRIKTYDSVEDILKEFFTVRLSFYVKRKDYLSNLLKAELKQLTNQVRFFTEMYEKVFKSKSKKDLVEELRSRLYDPDPVRDWEKQHQNNSEEKEKQTPTTLADSTEDYDYLFGFTMLDLAIGKKEELFKKKDIKMREYEIFSMKSATDLWREDLHILMEDLLSFEENE